MYPVIQLSYMVFVVRLLRTLDSESHSGCIHLRSYLQEQGSCVPTSSLEFTVICSLGDNHSDRYEKESQRHFYTISLCWHLLKDLWGTVFLLGTLH